ncbi:hypothetical protein [Ferrovibrio terrae]|uniref:hypothetical protein n=1 Tax=Ferrovibrio terrae TaxID=2594003 RepID=UPI00313774C7
MQYLGALRGTGTLTSGGEAMGRADYDFEGFVRPAGEINGSGEIRMPPAALKQAFGHKTVQLQTDAGQIFSLRFSDRKLSAASDVAHVDLIGNLPAIAGWGN